MADVNFAHLIDYFGSDNRTSCILIYMEDLGNARNFISAARAFSRSKPILLLKSGASVEGARVAQLQSGAPTANDAVYDAVFKRAGVVRVQTIQQLFDATQAVATQPFPKGRRLAIVSNAGGPAVIATDALIQKGGSLAVLSAETISHLDKQLPAYWSGSNPVDIPGSGSPEQFRAAIEACLFDPNVDGVLAILTAQSNSDAETTARLVVETSKKIHQKPVYASWMGMQHMKKGRVVLEQGKVPWYPFPERAVTTFMHMVNYRENLEMVYETPSDSPIEFDDIRKADARQIIQNVYHEERRVLSESESKQLLACYGIPVNTGHLATDEDGAVALASAMGYPVALKIESPDIRHKSEVYGVRLGIESEQGVRQVYRFLLQNVATKRPDARLIGVKVEKMVPTSHELLIGASKDPVFGPVIVFGFGGITTDIWQDRAIGLPPLNMALASQMIRGTRIARLLQGYRNLPAVPLEYLKSILVRFAYLVMDLPELQEFEMNPFAMDESGGIALDARGSLENPAPQPRKPYEHLSILPYPSQWMRTVQLRNGQPVLLRPIRPEDEAMEARLVAESSRESLYFRFFGYISELDHNVLARFTQIDYDREMAIVAQTTLEEETKLIGVVRIVGDGWHESCEYAILVADAWHGQGLGGILTDYIVEIARSQGYLSITASFLKTNGAMRRLFKKKGFKLKSGPDESDWAELKL
ncbi:MAG: bifunctional acetate--CoA ligase family protein/GNAT family N-acetyltransferase [Lewinellaceae bacterium]|nr:bifunctional acetate--CoA ligase family protein/GNAT family N-acetyltransferase [Lewinellaceae bacterium]